MGPGRHHPRGRVGLGLSGTVGSAVLYGAIVVFGIGSASPSALDAGPDRNRSVVLVPQHADIVPGSVKKLPQASPEPGRHRSPVRQQPARTEVVSAPSPTPATVESQPAPAPPRAKESTSSAATDSSPARVAEPTPGLTIPTLTVPELPPPLPPLPALPVQLPELAVPPLQLPVALPLDLPG